MKLKEEVFVVPEVYTRSETLFWEEEYISKKLLEAHLDTNFEGASRNEQFMETSVSWIHEQLPETIYPVVLDLGCGPGLYSERLCHKGYQVTGVDISKRSIAYAKDLAQKEHLAISYQCTDYLQLEIQKTYDLMLMIYCDYGALTKVEREVVMQKVYDGLRPGGVFLLDVFSDKVYSNFVEEKTWNYVDKDGFWLPHKHVTLQRNTKYPNLVTLEQTVVISEDTIKNYYIWNTSFTEESLIQEADKVGFKVEAVYGNVAGKNYTKDGETICFILRK